MARTGHISQAGCASTAFFAGRSTITAEWEIKSFKSQLVNLLVYVSVL